MTLTNNILLSEFLKYNVKCDQGVDHGSGFVVWMHPPVHRVLGWITRPSALKLSLEVWRLDQLKGILSNNIYVKGKPANSDQSTIDRFPTLINANLLDNKGQKMANIVDLVFHPKTGKILYYLVSRSNPNIPGSSRWSLTLDDIKDQQPGTVLSNLSNINDLPLIRSSIREELLQKSKGFRNQIQEFTDKATNRLEGWLEESPLEDNNFTSTSSFKDDWIDQYEENSKNNFLDLDDNQKYYNNSENDSDPWV